MLRNNNKNIFNVSETKTKRNSAVGVKTKKKVYETNMKTKMRAKQMGGRGLSEGSQDWKRSFL